MDEAAAAAAPRRLPAGEAMTAVTSVVVRTGRYSLSPGPDSDVCGHANQPDIYAHVYRKGLRLRWSISVGRGGRLLKAGKAWTRGGAMVAAIAAAHRSDATGAGR